MQNLLSSASRFTLGLVATIGLTMSPCNLPATAIIEPHPLGEQQAREIGSEAYCYFYPLITMEVTRKQSINSPPGNKPGFGPANTFSHMRTYPDADFKSVVRPNFDTLYSPAWLDLTREPMIVSVPDTFGRYYLLPMLDMWTDVFAAPGWRTSGTAAKDFAIVAPEWYGPIPKGIECIYAPTSYVWIIGRIKTDGPEDYKAVNALQDGLVITPLSQWGKPSRPAAISIDPNVDMTTPPLETVNKMPAKEYFARAAELLKQNKPHKTDWSMLARLKSVGFEPGKSFDMDKIDPSIARGLTQGAEDGLKLMVSKVKTMGRPVNGWTMNTDSMGVYGNYYLKRAIISMVGLGANQPEDAIYPLSIADGDGQPLVGEKNYVLHFGSDRLPPANAFWSLTMYDSDGFQVPNAINRFAVSSWMPLKRNLDGSLDIYIQHENPGADKQANWLPSPSSGPLGVTMRLYAPNPSALNGDWVPPAIRKAH